MRRALTKSVIAKGYASGNLAYTADWYNGVYNDGEFTVSGTSFTPNALLEGKKYYYASNRSMVKAPNQALDNPPSGHVWRSIAGLDRLIP